MSNPCAIAVYTSGSGVPNHVSERPWRGVVSPDSYGNMSGLGHQLMAHVQRVQGDMESVVRQLIDESPRGLRHGIQSPDEPEGDRFTEEDARLRVAPDKTDMRGYVYVFDLEARRLDVFSTLARYGGKRMRSVVFSETGTPDLRALDLLPAETVDEPLLPGEELSAQTLKDWIEGLPMLEADSTVLYWGDTEEGPDGALAITLRVATYEDGSIVQVVESLWDVVPPSARLEPERVRNLLDALVDVVRENPKRLDPFWISEQDTLRRSGARQRKSLAKVLRARWARSSRSEK
ncbi:hypothetical protein MYSTI_07700 [Myxococcus stipitatus DSM 14675]|uniref:Uncharacterized protein n=1 Tax=Myxococcus stipitatus (strain DSM 14675 / JCM 12634 / Mx s8) TaxID=1278073 RepID=L7UN44_MYXSD|nr:hypothetical protein MYSTI_07700 [Myxococcus stipitatus DSM 14675]